MTVIWTERQTAQLAGLLQNAAKKGIGADAYEDISQKTGKSVADIVAQADYLHIPSLVYDYDHLIQQCIDISPRNVDLEPKKFETAHAVIASDLHIPAIDWVAFDQVMSHAAGADLFHAGDIMNNDAFSPFPDGARVQFEDEVTTMTKIIQYWDKYCNSVTIIMGNHDNDWLRRGTHGNLSLPMLIRMIAGKNIRVVPSTNCEVNNWFVCHPKEYSRVPLTVGIKLANVHEKNIAGGHQHNVGWGTSPAGHVVVDLGGLMSEEKMSYSQYNSASNPKWKQGFMTLDGENWRLLSNANNWGKIV